MPLPPASLSGLEPPAGISSTVDERGGSFGLGTRVPASLTSRGPLEPPPCGRRAGLVWGPGASLRAFALVPLLPTLGGSQGGLMAREMAGDPPSPLSLRIDPGEGDAEACGERVRAAGTWGGGLAASHPSPALATVPPECGQALPSSGLSFPIPEQRVGLAGCPLGAGRRGAFLVPVGVG